MKKNEGKPGKYVYLRDRMEKWNDRLWAIFDLSYLAVAGARLSLRETGRRLGTRRTTGNKNA
jgi:hypothetical protein